MPREDNHAAFVDTYHRVAGCFNNDPVSCFAPLQFVLSALTIVNIGLQKIPSNDATLSIAKRAPAKIKPSVDTIETPGPQFNFMQRCSRLTSFMESVWSWPIMVRR